MVVSSTIDSLSKSGSLGFVWPFSHEWTVDLDTPSPLAS
jgi:hypothetical protein